MQEILHNISSDTGSLLMFLLFGVGGVIGGLIAFVAIIFGTIRSISQRSEIEESRREIAAYVAEGSMTTEEGERLLNAGASKKSTKRTV